MKVLDLFSGIGGFSLGLERAGMETVAFCEIEPFCRKVLAKHWPGIPIHRDIRELTAKDLPDDIGLICGGYPCQPFSLAGKRAGENDDRHLWPEYLRLIREIRPSWVIGENVVGHITMGLDAVLSDLESEGYSWEAFVIPACAVDAPHRRDRAWIVGNTEGGTVGAGLRPDGPEGQRRGRPGNASGAALVANTVSDRPQGVGENGDTEGQVGLRGRARRNQIESLFRHGASWKPEPSVGRVANGVPFRVDRLRCLGNAVVPQIPEIIGRAIMEIERASP